MSNETPKPSPAKTKSAPKLRRAGILLLGLALLLAVILYTGQRAVAPELSTLQLGAGSQSAKTYKLETVSTAEDQSQGLSGRSGLPAEGGMLFAYEGGMQNRCIWMKDMKFSIDVVWLDSSKRIVSMVQGMSPSSYPRKYCATAESVVELPAGTIREHGLRPGQTLNLD